MTTPIYPTLPGLSWDVERTEIWNTAIVESQSGRRYASGNWTIPKRKFRLNYNFLRENQQEFSTLVGFFNARKGNLEPFFWLDPLDYVATNQGIGLGDGSNKDFQLGRSFGGSFESVYGVKSISKIYVGGVETNAYTYTENGLITLTSAPALNTQVSWTGEFYQLVCFSDELSTTEFAERLLNGSVDLETVKL